MDDREKTDSAAGEDADREDLNDMMSLMSDASAQLKWGGVLLGLGDSRAERGSLLPVEMNACLPGCVWNATPRSLSPLERNIGFWTQA